MNDITKSKYNYIRADELMRREQGLSLMSDEKLPLLPEWNDKLTLPPSFDEYMEDREKSLDKKANGKDN